MESRFFNLQGKRKLVPKIGEFEKSRVKLQCSTDERKTSFGSSYREVQKMTVIKIGPKGYCFSAILFPKRM